jgi:hypothetical protein
MLPLQGHSDARSRVARGGDCIASRPKVERFVYVHCQARRAVPHPSAKGFDAALQYLRYWPASSCTNLVQGFLGIGIEPYGARREDRPLTVRGAFYGSAVGLIPAVGRARVLRYNP